MAMTGGWGTLARWVRLTWAGWLLGIPAIIVLALVGEAVGVGGAQVLVGAGMGAGVGFLQGRFVRDLTGRAGPWIRSSAVGLALPFLLADGANAAGIAFRYSLHLSVAVGGLVAGAWQARLLRARFRHTASWIPASAAGWMLAGGSAALADAWRYSRAIHGPGGALAYLGLIAGGGLVLGLITGVALAAMLRRESTAPAAGGA